MSPRYVDRDKKIREIIFAGINVIAPKGFHNTKMEDVAREAGIGKGTLYEYFPSKEDFFEAIIRFYFEEQMKDFEKILHMDIKEGLSTMVDMLFEIARKDEKYINLFFQVWGQSFGKESKVKKLLKDFVEEYMEMFTPYISRGQKQGIMRDDFPPELLTRIIFSTFDGLLLQIMLFYDKLFEKKEKIKSLLLSQWLKERKSGNHEKH